MAEYRNVNDIGQIVFPICTDCKVAIRKNVVSPYMISSQNYGLPQSVLGMKVFDLSVLSKNSMFPIRSYGSILELRHSGNAPVMNGSMIHFDSEALVVTEEARTLPMADAANFIQVHFLGDSHGLDRIKETLGSHKRSPVRVEAQYNMQVLRLLQKLHPDFLIKIILSDEDGVRRQDETLQTVLRQIVINTSATDANASSAVSSNLTLPPLDLRWIDQTVLYKKALPNELISPEIQLIQPARVLFNTDAQSNNSGTKNRYFISQLNPIFILKTVFLPYIVIRRQTSRRRSAVRARRCSYC